MRDALADVRVVGPPGAPVGFSIVKDDELYHESTGWTCALREAPAIAALNHTLHSRQSSALPTMAARPSGVCTHGRTCQGGSWRTCWVWPHSSSATQWPSVSS